MIWVIGYVIMSVLTFTAFALYEKYDSEYVEKEDISVFIVFAVLWPAIIPTLSVYMVLKWIVNFLHKLVNK